MIVSSESSFGNTTGRERGGRFEPGLGEEALRERRQAAIGQVEFDALDAVHGEEYDGGSEGFAVAHHHREILEGREFGAAQAKAIGGKSQDHSPEFFARTAQGRNDQSAGVKGFARLGLRRLSGKWLSTLRLSPGEARIANPPSSRCDSADSEQEIPVCWADMQSAAASPVIEFRDVSYRVAGTQVLSGFNLEVQRGETVVLLGRSGSGKTTSLKLVNRLLTPTSGEIRVKGVSNAEGDVIRLRRSIGYVIQDVGLFPHFTVEKNIGLVPRIEGWPEERVRGRVLELLQMVGLPRRSGVA